MDPILAAFDRQFLKVDERSRELLDVVSEDDLYRRPRRLRHEMTPFSCGEYILRSAAMVEKTFGGITTRLWDDPFEWTLPEKLDSRASIINYLDETEATRKRGFSFFTSDKDLTREIPAPEKMRPIIDILIDTLARAEHYQGRAFAMLQVLSDEQLPRI